MRGGISKGKILRGVQVFVAPSAPAPQASDEERAIHEASLIYVEENKHEKIDVRMIDRELVIKYRVRLRELWAMHQIPESSDWAIAWINFFAEVVSDIVAAVWGMEIDGSEIGERPPAELVAALRQIPGALADVGRAALRAQDPTAEERNFLGSAEPSGEAA